MSRRFNEPVKPIQKHYCFSTTQGITVAQCA
jgi:hypothetical protein